MISVVVPVYNVEKYIVNCLESIVNQSYKDFELLIVNDGSQDNSIKLAEEYLKSSTIDWTVINKDNGGLASARNEGIKHAKGEYISFVDSDDYIAKDFLKKLIDIIRKDDYDFSFCNFKYIKSQYLESNVSDNDCAFVKQELLSVFLKRTINFVVPSMLFKKEFLVKNNLFFNEEIKFSEDQPFIWNVILHSNKTIYSYNQLYGYYLRQNSIMTSSSFEKIKNSYIEYKNYIDAIFNNYQEYDYIKSLILPRWQLGTLYSAARILDYSEYRRLYDLFDGKNIYERIKTIDELKAIALAMVASISCKLIYKMSNKLDLTK